MPEGATSLVTARTEQIMLEMVHDRVATGCCTAMWKAYATRETINVKRNTEARF